VKHLSFIWCNPSKIVSNFHFVLHDVHHRDNRNCAGDPKESIDSLGMVALERLDPNRCSTAG
jgi:hypothetical protein